jgi:predicted Zn finger-like uncharacterized protein
MALATRCPNCHALFRVAADQLKLRGGLVRCGACQHVFDAFGTLSYIDDAVLSAPPPAPTGSDGSAPALAAEPVHAPAAGSVSAQSLAGGGADSSPEQADGPSVPAGAAGFRATAQIGTSSAEPRPPETQRITVAGVDGVATVQSDSGEITAGSAGTREGAAGDGPALAEVANLPETTGELPQPSFLRDDAAPPRRRFSILLGGGAVLLALLALAQLAVLFRADILVQYPAARPALTQLCKVFRCTVDWPARGDLLAVVGSELQALPGTGALELTAVVRNRGSFTLALPAIELTLTDTLNRTVARKVFAPVDYLASEPDPAAHLLAGLEAGADLTIRIAFEAPGLKAVGFVVYPFYL